MNLFKTYLKPFTLRIVLGMSIKFSGSLMDLFLPWILSYMIDSVIPTKNISLVVWWGVIMIIISILGMVTNIIANRMASSVARDAVKNIRKDLFTKISYLSTAQFDTFGVPSLVSRLTTDTYNVHQTIGMGQRIGIRAPILLLGGIAITASLDPVLTLVLVAVLPFTALTVYFVSKKGIPLFAKLQKQIDHLVLVIRENITGAKVIKALSKTEYEIKRFTKVNDELVMAETKANKTMAKTPALMNFFLNAGLTLVILVAAFRVNNGLTQPGVIVAFLTYFTIILNAMLSITRIFVAFSRGLASANRISQVLMEKEDLKVIPSDTFPTAAEIIFDHVTFSYPNGKPVLEEISFSLEKGKTLGIIGGTGSGKSTLVKLLLRLYDVQKGNIYYRGKNIKSYKPETLYQKFGVVLQKDTLFAESIRENIAMGRPLSPEEIKLSTIRAQGAEFILKLPGKLDYELEAKGSNLSGGQKQRVLLSRALAGNPEVLILDDSSSALDYKTDAKLRKELKKLTETTKILIAQRISSIQQADEIIVLEKGKMIAKGTHEELLKVKSYEELFLSQGGELNA